LFDAVAIDGAGPVRSFMRIGVPLAGPAIVTVGLFAFLAAWTDFVNAFTLDSGGRRQRLTLGLYKAAGLCSSNLGAILAATTIAVIRTTVRLIGGLRAGGLKG
jgi:multiple sugar transport system permease protein